MIDKLVKVMVKAQANAPYYVMPQYKNKYNVFLITPSHCADECVKSLVTQDEAEDECERLNNRWVVVTMLEAMKNSSLPLLDATINAIIKGK